MNRIRFNKSIVFAIFALVFTFFAPRAHAQSRSSSDEAQRVVDHWTKERIQGAIPRDLDVDERGLGYLHKPDGSLQPYGRGKRLQDGRMQSHQVRREGTRHFGGAN